MFAIPSWSSSPSVPWSTYPVPSSLSLFYSILTINLELCLHSSSLFALFPIQDLHLFPSSSASTFLYQILKTLLKSLCAPKLLLSYSFLFLSSLNLLINYSYHSISASTTQANLFILFLFPSLPIYISPSTIRSHCLLFCLFILFLKLVLQLLSYIN